MSPFIFSIVFCAFSIDSFSPFSLSLKSLDVVFSFSMCKTDELLFIQVFRKFKIR